MESTLFFLSGVYMEESKEIRSARDKAYAYFCLLHVLSNFYDCFFDSDKLLPVRSIVLSILYSYAAVFFLILTITTKLIY